MDLLILEYIGEGFCDDEKIIAGLKIVGYILSLAKLFVPLIIIGWGIFDIYKSVMAGTTDSLSSQFKSLAFRLIIGIFIFFIPTLLNLFLNGLPNYTADIKGCQQAILDPFNYEGVKLYCEDLDITSCANRSDCIWNSSNKKCEFKTNKLPCNQLTADSCTARSDCEYIPQFQKCQAKCSSLSNTSCANRSDCTWNSSNNACEVKTNKLPCNQLGADSCNARSDCEYIPQFQKCQEK